jgi:hypothetical protein
MGSNRATRLPHKGVNRIERVRAEKCEVLAKCRAQLQRDFVDDVAGATTRYVQAVSELAALVEHNGHKAQSSEYYAKAKQEREKCKRTHKELDDHVAEHHCGTNE